MKTMQLFRAGLVLVSFLTASGAHAATITLTNNDAITTSSFNTGLNWGGNIAPTSGNTYVTAAFGLRTPENASNYTFAGDALTVSAGGSINYKGANGTVITVTNLILNGGRIGIGNSVTGTIAGGITLTADSAIDAASTAVSDPRTLILTAPISGNFGLIVTNIGSASTNGVVILAGANTYTGATTVVMGTLRLGAGGSLISSGALTVNGAAAAANLLGNYTNAGGFVTVQNGGTLGYAGTGLLALASAPSSITNSARLVVGNGSAGTFNMTGGSLVLTNGYGVLVGRGVGGAGVFTMTGGSLMVTNTGSTNGGFVIGHSAAAGSVTVTGGTLSLGYGGGRVFIGGGEVGGPYGTGTLTVAGSGVVDIGPAGTFPNEKVYLAGFGGKGVINLNGGTLISARDIQLGGGGPATLVFNGGTLRAGISSATFLNANLNITNNPGGAIVDTAGFTNTIAAAILNGGGGLTKIGNGVLTLSNVGSTFTGDVVVAAGTLVASVGNNAAAPANTALGAVTGVGGRTITVNSNATLRFAANDVLGNGASTPTPTLVITNGGLVIVSNNFVTLGPVLLSGGTLTGFRGANATFQQYSFAGSVTVTGNAVSTISSSGGGTNGDHLAANTAFNVAEVTGDSSADLVVSAPLINQNGSLLSVPGGLTKTGDGTMRLDANNLFTGTANVNGGTLALGAGGSLSNATVNVGAGGIFDVTAYGTYTPPPGAPLQGSGLVTGSVFTADASRIFPGGPGTPGTLTFANSLLLSMTSGYTNYFDLTNSLTIGGGVNDLLVINEDFEPVNNPVMINALAPLVSGTYRLINYGTNIGGMGFGALLGATSRDTWTLDTSVATQVNLIVSAGTNLALRWSANTSADWDLGTTNWTVIADGSTDRYYDVDTVLFDDAGALSNIVNLTTTVKPAAVTVNSSSNYLIAGAGGIADGFGFYAPLLKDGSGSLTLGTANSFSGGIVVSNGSVVLATNGAAGLGPISLASGTTLEDTAGGAVPGAISGGGQIVKTGSGTLTLSGTNSYTGTTTISNGAIVVSGPGYLGGGSYAVDISNNGSLTMGGATQLLSGTISGTGSLTQAGANTLTLGGSAANTYSGLTTVTGPGGQLGLSKTGGAVAIPGDITLTSSGATRVIVFGTQDNQFGPTSVMTFLKLSTTEGRFELLGTTQTLAGVVDATGSGFIQHREFAGPAQVDGLSTLVLNGSGNYSYNGALRNMGGPMELIKNGSGTQALVNAAITYTSATTVASGTLTLRDTTAFVSPVAVGPSGTLEVVRTATGFNNRSAIAGSAITGSGIINANNTGSGLAGGWVIVRAATAANFTGTLNVNSGVFGTDSGGVLAGSATVNVSTNGVLSNHSSTSFTIGGLNGAGDVSPAQSGGGTYNLTVGAADKSGSYAGAIHGNNSSGATDGTMEAGFLSLTKIGTGTQTLSGTNTYSGITIISNGTLALGAGGSITGTPRIIVATGATFDVSTIGNIAFANFQSLEGGGLVTGSVATAMGSKIIPGGTGSVATLTLGNNLNLIAGTTNLFDLTSSTNIGSGMNDLVDVGGLLEPSNAVIVINPLAPLATGSYRLFNYTGTKASSFSTTVITNPTRKSWTIDEATPGQVNLAVSGSYLGLKWNSQTSTNWDTNIGTNWFDIAGATNTTFIEADHVLFDDSGAITNNIAMIGTLKPSSVTVNSASNYSISGTGRISGLTGLTKDGTGTLTLGGTGNDYLGAVVVSGGVIKAATAGFLGKASGVTVLPAGQVNLNGVAQTGSSYIYTISGSGPDGRGAIVNTNVNIGGNSSVKWVELAGNATIGVLVTPAANENGRMDIALSGGINGNGYTLTKVGAAPLDIRGSATNLQLVINEGMVYGENVNDPFGSNVIVNAGGIIGGYSTARTFNVAVTLNGGTLASRQGGGAPRWTGPITLATDSFAHTTPGYGYGAEDIQVDGVISGPGSLTKRGATAALRLNNTNTFAGGLVIQNYTNSIVVLASTNGPAIASNVQIGHTNVGGGVAYLYTSNHNQFASGVALSFKGSPNDFTWLKLFGTTQTVASITSDDFGGGVIDHVYQEAGYNTDSTLVLTGPGDSYWSGNYLRDSSIGTSTGKLRIIQSGTGTVTLAGGRANTTFSGGITVNSGVLNVKSLYSAGRGTITMAGGTLALDASGLKEDVVGTAAINKTVTNTISSAVTLWPARATLNADIPASTQFDYSGYIINTSSVPVTWTFAEQFDDSSYLKIDNTVVLNDTVHSNPTLGTITLTPGLHSFDLRLHNGSGGGGVFNFGWWTNTSFAVGVDFQGLGIPNQTNFQRLEDNGSGSLLVTDVQVSNNIVLLADTTVRVASVWGPTNSIQGPISGSFGVTKSGAGALELSGTNSYAGPTTIAAGKLFMNGTYSGAGAYTATSNTLLWGTGVASVASATIQGGAQLGPQDTSVTGALTVADLTMNAGSTLSAMLRGTNPTHRSLGNFASSPGIAVQLLPVAPLSLGTNVLVDYGTNFTGNITDFAVSFFPNGGQGDIVNNITDSRIEVLVTNAGLGIKWDGAADATWKQFGQQNWKTVLAGSPTIYQAFDTVLFDDTATGLYTVNLTEAVTPGSLTVNSASNYTFTGLGKIGSGVSPLQLVKDGAGSLTVLTDNDYSGGTIISNGAVQMGNGGGVGLLGTGVLNVAGASTLTFFRSNNALTVNNPLRGSGTVVFKGTGAALEGGYLLGGNNTNFTGLMVLTNARITVDNANDLGGPGSTIVVQDGGSVLQSAGTFGRPISIAGLGWLEAGRFGALRVDNATWNTPVTLAANARIGAITANGTITGTISGPYELEIWSGSATVRSITLTPTNPNTYASLRISSNIIAVAGNTNAFSTGPVIMNGGTQRLAGFSFAFSNLSSTAAGGTIANQAATPCTFTVGLDGSSTIYSGIFADTGAGALNVTKVGGGTLTLQGASVNTGIYTIAGGTLALGVGGSITGTPRIVISTGATFDVSILGNFGLVNFQSLEGFGTVSGNVTTATASKLTPGTAGTVGTLTFATNLNLTAATTNYFDLTGDTTIGSNDLIDVGGLLEPSNSVIVINPLAPLATGTYRLFTYTGTKTTTFSTTVITNASRKIWTIDETTPGQVNLVVSGGNYLDLVWNAQTSANWDTNIGTNWFDSVGLTNSTFIEMDNVLFDDSGAMTNSIALVGTVKPGSITVSASSNYTVGGAGKISGLTGLNKGGTGTLNLGGTNDFTGPVAVTGGTVSIINDLNLGAVPAAYSAAQVGLNGGALKVLTNVTISANRGITLGANGGTLDSASIVAANMVNFNSIIAGSGPLTLNANGDISDNGGGSPGFLNLGNTNNSFAGSIAINSGVVAFSGDTAFGNATNVITINGGGLVATVSRTLNHNVVLAGGGDRIFRTYGAQVLTLNGDIGGSGNVRHTDGGSVTFNGTLSHVGSVINPMGIVTLNGTNTYDGGTTIFGGGIVAINSLSDSGPSALSTNGVLTFNTGTLRFTAAGSGSTARSITNTGASTYDITNALATVTLTGPITGPGSLTKIGSGTLALGSAAAYQGTTIADAGTLTYVADNPGLKALVFGAAVNSTNIPVLDLSNASVTATSYSNIINSVSTSRIVIGSARALTINGSFYIGPPTTNVTTSLSISGPGSFIVSHTNALFKVGNVSPAGNTPGTANLDMRGLASANIDLGAGSFTIGAGDNSTRPHNVFLAATNTVTAASLYVGASGVGGLMTMRLGTASNVFNVDSFNIGNANRDWGIVSFGSTGGTMMLRDRTGTGRASFNMGPTVAQGTGYPMTNTFDVSGHYADLLIGTLNIGMFPHGVTSPTVTNTFIFDTGVLDVATNRMAINGGTNGNAATMIIGGGIVNFGSGGVIIASNGMGVLIINGGIVTSAGDITRANPTNPVSRASLFLSGGTLDMQGHNLGGVTPINTLSLGAGTLANVAQINNGAAWAKTTAGMLVIDGTNGYTGPVSISNGTLMLNGSISGLGGITVVTGTLGGTGSVAGTVTQTGGSVAPGASAGTLTVGTDFIQIGGSLDIQIAGTTPGSGFDVFAVGGTAGLSSTLNVTTNGYAPVAGNTFTVLTATAVSGTFGTTNLPPLSPVSLGWSVQYLSNAVVLSVTGAPPPATGYDAWSNLYVLAQGPEGDDDGDGYANLLEYVTGANPTNNASTSPMSASRTNGNFALHFNRDTNSIDATLIVEGSYASTNDAPWLGIATNTGGSWGGATNVNESGSSPVNVTVFDNDPVATNRFLRLRVTRP